MEHDGKCIGCGAVSGIAVVCDLCYEKGSHRALIKRIHSEAQWGWDASASHTKTCNARTALAIILELLAAPSKEPTK